MKHESSIRHVLLVPALLALAMTLSLGPAASAQTPMSQGNDSNVTRGDLPSFDRFMDSHPEIAEQLRRDPSLVKNKEFAENHPALQEYMQQHPEVREEIGENPGSFMRREERFDRREDQRAVRPGDDATRRELGGFDRFMDSHPEIAEQLRRDPSLVKNKEFAENHPALQEYMQQHPEVREEIGENPGSFMRREQRFDRREDHRDHAFDRAEVEGFGHFLGDHSSVASQLARNPSLANNEEFVESHPDLQQYMKEHPGAQKQLTSNPQNFVQSAQQFTNSTAAPKTQLLNPQPKPQK